MGQGVKTLSETTDKSLIQIRISNKPLYHSFFSSKCSYNLFHHNEILTPKFIVIYIFSIFVTFIFSYYLVKFVNLYFKKNEYCTIIWFWRRYKPQKICSKFKWLEGRHQCGWGTTLLSLNFILTLASYSHISRVKVFKLHMKFCNAILCRQKKLFYVQGKSPCFGIRNLYSKNKFRKYYLILPSYSFQK